VQHFKNNVRSINTKCGLDERLERLDHVDLLRLLIFGAPDALIPIAVADFIAVNDFLKSCKRV